MKYQVVRCWCIKGEPMSASINNKRLQEDAGTFDTREKAEKYKERLQKQEAQRIKRERKDGGWNGNEFVFWIDEISDKEVVNG
jgi:hypothetical protein